MRHSRLNVQAPFTVCRELPLGHPAQECMYPGRTSWGRGLHRPGSGSGPSGQGKGVVRGESTDTASWPHRRVPTREGHGPRRAGQGLSNLASSEGYFWNGSSKMFHPSSSSLGLPFLLDVYITEFKTKILCLEQRYLGWMILSWASGELCWAVRLWVQWPKKESCWRNPVSGRNCWGR